MNINIPSTLLDDDHLRKFLTSFAGAALRLAVIYELQDASDGVRHHDSTIEELNSMAGEILRDVRDHAAQMVGF